MDSTRIEQLRAKLTGLRGVARVGPLTDLVQALANRYSEIGAGRPEALPCLNEAIEVGAEAYEFFDANDPWRRRLATLRGWLVGMRHVGHGGPDDDRSLAIELLTEGLVDPEPLPPTLLQIARLTLGQLYLMTFTRALNGLNVAAVNAGSALPPGAEADADRAVECFRLVTDDPGVRGEIRDVAAGLLKVSKAFRTVIVTLRDGVSSAGVHTIMEAMEVIQEFHRDQMARAGQGRFTVYDGDKMASAEAIDRPVILLDTTSPAPAPTPAQPARPAHVPDVTELRAGLRDRAAGGRELFTAMEAMADPSGAPPSADLVDDLVALGTAVVDSGTANRTDNLLLALGLLLRARSTGAPANRLDLEDAADQLLHAADPARPAPPEAVRIMHALAAGLDRLRGDSAVTDRLAARLPSRSARLRPIGEAAVFVANPRGDDPAAARAAALLRQTFYPRSTGLGNVLENIDASGTPADVLSRMNASLLHLECGVTPAGALELAGPAELAPPEIVAATRPTGGGGLAVLPRQATGRAAAELTNALLTAGFSAVIAWRHTLDPDATTLIGFVLHSHLVDGGLSPAKAISAVHTWLTESDRPIPRYLPDELITAMRRIDLGRDEYVTALTCHSSA